MKKISLKAKLIPALAMLIVSAITLSTATYAWFTMSGEVTVTNMTLKAKAPDSVQISLTGAVGDFHSTVDFARFYGADNLETLLLEPASSVNGVAFFEASAVNVNGTAIGNYTELTAGDAYAGYTLGGAALTTPVDQSVNYIDIPIWLRSQGEATALKITINVGPGANGTNDNLYRAVRAAAFVADAPSSFTTANGTGVIIPTFNDILGIGKAMTERAPEEEYGQAVSATTAVSNITQYADSAFINLAAASFNDAGANTSQTKIYVRVWIEGNDTNCIDAYISDMAMTIEFSK